METTAASIMLHSVRPHQNRQRAYTIQVKSSQSLFTPFIVRLAWGRIGKALKKQELVFQSVKDMMTFVDKTMKKRATHGYKIVEKSDSFPEVSSLALLGSLHPLGRQLSLFNE